MKKPVTNTIRLIDFNNKTIIFLSKTDVNNATIFKDGLTIMSFNLEEFKAVKTAIRGCNLINLDISGLNCSFGSEKKDGVYTVNFAGTIYQFDYGNKVLLDKFLVMTLRLLQMRGLWKSREKEPHLIKRTRTVRIEDFYFKGLQQIAIMKSTDPSKIIRKLIINYIAKEKEINPETPTK